MASGPRIEPGAVSFARPILGIRNYVFHLVPVTATIVRPRRGLAPPRKSVFIRQLRNGDSARFIKCSTSPRLWVCDVGGKPVTV